MKLYEVRTTEYNGEQEYSFSHLLAARNLIHAKALARKYFQNWYQDDGTRRTREDDPDSFEFVDGSIILRIKGVCETTLEDWLDRQIELHRIDKLPKAKSSCKKCGRLLESCEHMRDCLDVGKDQFNKKEVLKTATIKEQCPDTPYSEIKVNILFEGGKIWIQPQGYGDKCSADGDGWPIALEIWQGRLRLIVYDDINKEDPQIINLDKSKESCRLKNEQG